MEKGFVVQRRDGALYHDNCGGDRDLDGHIIGVLSLFSTFSEFYLLSVASVGPEAWRALHEYINGDTLRERCRLLVQQAALDDGSAPLVKHSEVPISLNRDMSLSISKCKLLV